MDFPAAAPMLPLLSTFSREGVGANYQSAGGTLSTVTAATSSANQAKFTPLLLSAPFLLSAFWWLNAGAVSGNIDVGLYTRDGTKLASTGSTAQSGTSAMQSAALGTPILLMPGAYYLAWSLDNTTGQLILMSSLGLEVVRTFGMYTMASAFPLPATATFATAASGRLAIVGIASRTVL